MRNAIFILFFLFISVLKAQLYVGDAKLHNQQDVIDFGAKYTETTGDLVIDGQDITDLSPLSNFKKTGLDLDLYISSLVDLHGLEGLKEIGRHLSINAWNKDLRSLDGLNNLESIGDYLSLNSLENLENIDGLENVTYIGGNVDISYDLKLEDIDGLKKVTTIGGYLWISYNKLIINIDALSELSSLGSSLNISSNESLVGFCGLYNLLNNGWDGTYIVENNANNPTQAQILAGGSCDPLPVELTTFSASVVKNKVKLNWETATEVNNYGFSVERKLETGDWSKLGFVEGSGNSNSPKHYSFIDNGVISGKYFYRLKQIDFDGSFEYSAVVEVNLTAPENYKLSQNYPNPFNPATTIEYSIPVVGVGDENFRPVQLKVYDILGREVATLVNKKQKPGNYTVTFNAANLPSGIYYYRIDAGGFSQIRKMMLIK